MSKGGGYKRRTKREADLWGRRSPLDACFIPFFLSEDALMLYLEIIDNEQLDTDMFEIEHKQAFSKSAFLTLHEFDRN